MQFLMNRRARLGLKVNLGPGRPIPSAPTWTRSPPTAPPPTPASVRATSLPGWTAKSVLAGRIPPRDDRESLPGLRLIELAASAPAQRHHSGRIPPGQGAKDGLPGYRRRARHPVPAAGPGAVVRLPLPPGGPRRMASRLDEDLLVGAAVPVWLAPGPPRAGPAEPRSGPILRHHHGVLVISVPKDSELGLKGGDVVLAVDGRKPESPSHLLRILRSYEQGRELQDGRPAQPEAGNGDRPARGAEPTD